MVAKSMPKLHAAEGLLKNNKDKTSGRRTRTEVQQARAQTIGSELQKALFESSLQKMIDACRKDPELVPLINHAIDTGVFRRREKARPKPEFSHSQTYNYQVPKKILRQLFEEIWPDWDPKAFDHYDRIHSNTDFSYEMFQFALGTDLQRHIADKDVRVWRKLYAGRYDAVGKRLSGWVFPPAGTPVQWNKYCGVYKLLPERPEGVEPKDHEYKSVLHPSGVSVNLNPDDGRVTDIWDIENNYSDLAAALYNPRRTCSLPLAVLFEETSALTVVKTQEREMDKAPFVAQIEQAESQDTAATAEVHDGDAAASASPGPKMVRVG